MALRQMSCALQTADLEQHMHCSLEGTELSNPLFLFIKRVPINSSSASVNINLRSTQPSFVFPDISTNPKQENNWESKILLEEGGSTFFWR
jgi:hypothetical protein